MSVLDPNGQNRKVRPVVVVSDPTIDPDAIVAVCVSSQRQYPCPGHNIPLPYHPNRHQQTGLVRDCVAKCDWRVAVLPSDVIRVIGSVPEPILTAILFQVRILPGGANL